MDLSKCFSFSQASSCWPLSPSASSHLPFPTHPSAPTLPPPLLSQRPPGTSNKIFARLKATRFGQIFEYLDQRGAGEIDLVGLVRDPALAVDSLDNEVGKERGEGGEKRNEKREVGRERWERREMQKEED